MHIILDLDNTLICSLDKEEMKDVINQDIILDDYFYNKKNYKDQYGFRIYKRPHLDTFIKYLFNNFNVSVWTAASRLYGGFIIENILNKSIKNDLINFYHSTTCNKSEDKYPGTPKKLKFLFDKESYYHPCNTIIIDDLDEVNIHNKENSIRIPYFNVTKENASKDRALLDIIEYLKILKKRGTNCDVHKWKKINKSSKKL